MEIPVSRFTLSVALIASTYKRLWFCAVIASGVVAALSASHAGRFRRRT